jgi:hypothetical protein
MAVMVAFLQREFDVVRVKNRFENDQVEHVSAERTLAEFYAAETLGLDNDSTTESAPKSEKMYRDVLVNLRPRGSDFICEVQLTLTGISILKKSEQKIYALARMTSAEELMDTFVFSEQPEVRVTSMQPDCVPLPSRSNAFTTSAVPAAETAANAPDKIRESGRGNVTTSMHFYPEIRTAEDTGNARLAEGLQLEVESDLGLRKMDIEHGKVETIGEESVLPTATKGLGPTGLEETAETERMMVAAPAVDVEGNQPTTSSWFGCAPAPACACNLMSSQSAHAHEARIIP